LFAKNFYRKNNLLIRRKNRQESNIIFDNNYISAWIFVFYLSKNFLIRAVKEEILVLKTNIIVNFYFNSSNTREENTCKIAKDLKEIITTNF